MTTYVVVVGVLIYLSLYFTYGKMIEKKVVVASNGRETPARRLYDGMDYIPARRSVLFGHHFASIAGAAPIIGPALAICWGWLPGLLWVWFGNIFIGAVHDYLALMASVRYDGKSIQFVAADLFGRRTGRAFYWLVFFMLVLLVGAFGREIGTMFVATPAIASAFVWLIVAAIILGILIYRAKMNFTGATVIGILMLSLSIWLGFAFPMKATYATWMWVFFFYIIIAASIPVNVLLQPRDYLNSWLLYVGLAVGLLAAVSAFKSFDVPVFSSFSPILSGHKPTPFWPAIPLIIACGSLSGFHSIVASGTTSKQLERESDGLLIGYGAMFTEGLLSTIVIIAIAGFGYTAIKNAGAALDITVTLDPHNWGAMFTRTTAELKLAGANLFIQSYADMVSATWLGILPAKYIKIIAGMWVAAFAMTTLDTTNRVARYCVTEMAAPLKARATGLHAFLTNRWIASMIPAAIGIYLAASGTSTILWPSFGAANQIIASIALMTGACYVKAKLNSRFCSVAVIPAWILWITVTAALVWFMAVVLPGSIISNPLTGWTVLGICVIMGIMNIVFIFEFIRNYYGTRKE